MSASEPASVSTCIWIAKDGLAAARFYTSLFENSAIHDEQRYDELPSEGAERVGVISISLNGVPFQILDAGPHAQHSDMMSITVATPDQAETDRLWAALLEGGGREQQCGWLRDRWDVPWQIVPRRFTELMTTGDRQKVGAMIAEMMTMKKLDVAALEAAYEAGGA